MFSWANNLKWNKAVGRPLWVKANLFKFFVIKYDVYTRYLLGAIGRVIRRNIAVILKTQYCQINKILGCLQKYFAYY